MRKVRIARNRVGFADALVRLGRLVNVCAKVFYVRPRQLEQRALLDVLRGEAIRKRIELDEMRRQKLANELVLQDLKIEQKNSELGHPVPPEWTYHNNQP